MGKVNVDGLTKALRTHGKQFDAADPVQLAKYVSDDGDGYHTVDLQNPDGSQGVRTKVRGRVRAWAGVIVRVSRDRRRFGDELAIMGVDESGYGTSQAPAIDIPLHGEDHGYLQPDQIPNLHTWQIYPLRCHPSSGLTVEVLKGNYFAGGLYRSLKADTDVDLTSFEAALSTGEKQYVTISIDASGTVNTTGGTVSASPQATDIANVPTGEVGIAAALVQKGVTTITNTHVEMDLRFVPGTAGGATGASGGAVWSNETIVAAAGGQYTTLQAAINSLSGSYQTIWALSQAYTENILSDHDDSTIIGRGAHHSGVQATYFNGADDTGPILTCQADTVYRGIIFNRALTAGSGEYLAADASGAYSHGFLDCRFAIDDGATARDITALKIAGRGYRWRWNRSRGQAERKRRTF
jgi:hypothetical protein